MFSAGLPLHSRKREQGNVFFLILIGVVLFAALSYAITKSGRSGGTISKEQLKLQAANMINQAVYMQQKINSMMIINRCLDTQINFANASGSYSNPLSPANPNVCNVFDPAGGGLAWSGQNPSQVVTMSGLVAAGEDDYNGTEMALGAGTDAPMYTAAADAADDLMVFVPVFSADFCNALNAVMNLDPATISQSMLVYYSWFGPTQHYEHGPTVSIFPNPVGGCVSANAANWPKQYLNADYFFYYVLLAR